jgi:arylsulfatase
MERWKGIRKGIRQGNLEIELYDLEKDMPEQHNVAGTYPGVVAEMERIMKKEHTTPEIERFKMKALGDIP